MSFVASGAIRVLDRLVHEVLLELRVGIRMTSVANGVGPGLEHGRIIGTMGVMAAQAIAFGKRRMGVFALAGVLCFCVAGIAQVDRLCGQQPFLLCGVGFVAGQAALTLGNGGMGRGHGHPLFAVAPDAEAVPVLNGKFLVLGSMRIMAGKTVAIFEGTVLKGPPPFQSLGLMALAAQCTPLLQRSERVLRTGRIVAPVTHGRGNRVVYTRLEKFGKQGGMGVMAGRALFGGNRMTAVRLLERSLVAVVTVEAQFRLCLCQELLLIAAMGKVACLAALVQQDLVHEFLFKAFLLMALITDLIPR